MLKNQNLLVLKIISATALLVSCGSFFRVPESEGPGKGLPPAASRAWLVDSLRIRRADLPGHPCLKLEQFRKKYFEKDPAAAECSKLFEQGEPKGWTLHYRLVRKAKPLLIFETGESLTPQQWACVKGGALERLPFPAEIAFLAPDPRQRWTDSPSIQVDDTTAPGFDSIQGVPPVLKQGEPLQLSCHRMGVDLRQDEILEAKSRLNLMKASVGGAEPQTAGHWLERLWVAPYLDSRGLKEGWLITSFLPVTPCQLCLGKDYRESVPRGWFDQLESR